MEWSSAALLRGWRVTEMAALPTSPLRGHSTARCCCDRCCDRCCSRAGPWWICILFAPYIHPPCLAQPSRASCVAESHLFVSGEWRPRCSSPLRWRCWSSTATRTQPTHAAQSSSLHGLPTSFVPAGRRHGPPMHGCQSLSPRHLHGSEVAARRTEWHYGSCTAHTSHWARHDKHNRHQREMCDRRRAQRSLVVCCYVLRGRRVQHQTAHSSGVERAAKARRSLGQRRNELVRRACGLAQVCDGGEGSSGARAPVGRRHERHPAVRLSPSSLTVARRAALVDRRVLFVRLSEAPHLHAEAVEAAVRLPAIAQVAVAECARGLRHALAK